MPTQGLTLRGSWSSSYLAPKMKDFDVSLNAASAIDNSTAANGMHLLALTGNAAEALQAQQSDNFTIGLEWMPQSLRGASFSVTYYHIDYRDKIESVTVPIGTMLANPAAYPGVLILDPTLDQVNQYIALGAVSGRLFQALIQTPSGGLVPNPNFDPGSVELIVDSRRRNVGVVASRGFDVSAAYDIAMLGGEMRIGFDGAWIEDLLRQVTRTSSAISTLDTYGNPTHLRLRAQLGYRRGGWSFNSFVHHRNSYTDNRFTPFVELDSYTTVDANVAYRFASATGVLSGLSITFGAINLLDRDPPAARIRPTVAQYDLGFDPANASPLGRLLAIDVAKRW
jgi:outer membrane receptor protein involved in Fe transport